jgi:large subunit ribosomal protein L29
MRIDEIRTLSDADLGRQILTSKEDLFRLRFRHYTNQLEQQHTLGEAKQKIARLMTVQKERHLGISVPERKSKKGEKKASKDEPLKETSKEPPSKATSQTKKTSKKKAKKKAKKKTAKKKTKK